MSMRTAMEKIFRNNHPHYRSKLIDIKFSSDLLCFHFFSHHHHWLRFDCFWKRLNEKYYYEIFSLNIIQIEITVIIIAKEWLYNKKTDFPYSMEVLMRKQWISIHSIAASVEFANFERNFLSSITPLLASKSFASIFYRIFNYKNVSRANLY